MVKVNSELCVGCGFCAERCDIKCIDFVDEIAVIGSNCTDCGNCIDHCPTGAITK